MNLTVEQKNFVKELANLAWGTGGSSEHAAGGKGNMGLLYGQNGTVHVVKFNTHHSEAESAQRLANGGSVRVTDQVEASNALRNELEKLVYLSGMDKSAVDRLLGENANGTSLLTRKIVARFVTEVSRQSDDADLKNVWQDAEHAAHKSAHDMSFAKVAEAKGEYANFRLQVDNLNAELAQKYFNVYNRCMYLNSANPFPNAKIVWDENSPNKGLTAENLKYLKERFAELEKRGFGDFARMGTIDALAVKLSETCTGLTPAAADKIAAAYRYEINFDNEVGERVTDRKPGTFQDVVNLCLQAYGKREAHGLGWAVTGESPVPALCAVLKEIKPDLPAEKAEKLAALLAPDVAAAASAAVKNPESDKTLTDIVTELLDEKDIEEMIGEMTPFMLTVADMEKEFASSDLRDNTQIRENLTILRKLAKNHDRALLSLGKDEAAREAKMKELDANFRSGDKKRFVKAEGFMMSFQRKLGLVTLSDGVVTLHAETKGVKAALDDLQFALNLGAWWDMAKEKGETHGFLAALEADGCFQGRFTMLEAFVARLGGLDPNAVEGVVEHKEGEDVAVGLTNELAMAARIYRQRHPGKDGKVDEGMDVTWKQIRDFFGERVLGKTFAGKTWSAMTVYENLTTDILEWATVTPDKVFEDKLATIAANKKNPNFQVNMGQL